MAVTQKLGSNPLPTPGLFDQFGGASFSWTGKLMTSHHQSAENTIPSMVIDATSVIATFGIHVANVGWMDALGRHHSSSSQARSR